MSQLEGIAKRTLTHFILGRAGSLAPSDVGAVAAWAHKTALTSVLVSSEEQRAAGHGVPASEYGALYDLRETRTPPASQFWIGRYTGSRPASVRVIPVAVSFDATSEPDRPQGYAMTIVIGQLLIQGIRFTTPTLAVAVGNELGLPQIWPRTESVSWPQGSAVDDAAFLGVAGGKMLRSAEPPMHVRPWRPATELPASQAVGDMVELPTICGRHVVYYPGVLVAEAMRGHFYAFAIRCECPVTYLIHTEVDGAHCKAAGDEEVISNSYENLPGDEYDLRDEGVSSGSSGRRTRRGRPRMANLHHSPEATGRVAFRNAGHPRPRRDALEGSLASGQVRLPARPQKAADLVLKQAGLVVAVNVRAGPG